MDFRTQSVRRVFLLTGNVPAGNYIMGINLIKRDLNAVTNFLLPFPFYLQRIEICYECTNVP